MKQIKVLDKGYVRLNNVLGSELDIVNAARVSFAKESARFSDKDGKLIKFLLEHNHRSPFRHVFLGLEFYAPLMVARQAWKHVVGISTLEAGTNWNESSRRYITEEEEFYVPGINSWRLAPEDKKQGSGANADQYMGAKMHKRLLAYIENGEYLYREALHDGIAPEQARLFLPAYGMYVRWRWTASLDALLHFLELRQHAGAQYEIMQYANAIESFIEQEFPHVRMAAS
jgi:thymidylate synthase (FAD)